MTISLTPERIHDLVLGQDRMYTIRPVSWEGIIPDSAPSQDIPRKIFMDFPIQW